jgi:8-oxo-dGTP diphosphatase
LIALPAPGVVKRSLLHEAALSVLRVYWKVVRPKTFGVKVVVEHPQFGASHVVLVRNSYGNTGQWTLPGGGYRPAAESAETAAAREVREELGIDVEQARVVAEYRTQAQGKRDTVAIVACRARTSDLRCSSEVAQAEWCAREQMEATHSLASIARYALSRANER